MEVFLEVTVQHKKYHAGFMERMRQQPEVTSCYQVEGEHDFLVKADVTSEKELENWSAACVRLTVSAVCSRSMHCRRSYSHTRSRALKVSSKFSLP